MNKSGKMLFKHYKGFRKYSKLKKVSEINKQRISEAKKN